MRLGIFVLVVALAVGAWNGPAPRWESLQVQGGGAQVRALVRVPAEEAPVPAVLLVQGAHLPPEFLLDPARDLELRGFAVALVDLWPAPDPSGALAAVADELGRRPGVDGDRLALYAHSLGAAPGLAFACSGPRRPGASAVLGWDPSGPRDRPAPRNLLLAFGRFDDYVGVEDLLAGLAQVAPGPSPARPGEVTGSFGDGTARGFVLAPFSQHGGEPFDPAILDEAARWFDRSFGRTPAPPGPPTVALRHPALFLVLSGALVWLARGRPSRRAVGGALAAVLAGVATGLLPGLPGVWLALGLALILLDDPRAPIHLVALVLAVNLGVLLSHPGSGRPGGLVDWAATALLYETVFLPAQAHGILTAWQTAHPWPWWAALGFLAGLAGLAGAGRALVHDWLARWTATLARKRVLPILGTGTLVLAVAAVAGAEPARILLWAAAVPALAYAGAVRIGVDATWTRCARPGRGAGPRPPGGPPGPPGPGPPRPPPPGPAPGRT